MDFRKVRNSIDSLRGVFPGLSIAGAAWIVRGK